MSFISLPDGVKVTLEYTLNGKLVVNVYWATKSTPIVSIDLINIANKFADFWDNIRGGLSHTMTIQRIVAVDWSVPNGEFYQITSFTNPSGASPDASLPNNVALVTTLSTHLTGRSYRGRSYIAGIPESAEANNYVDSSYAAGFVSAFSDLDSSLNTGGYQFVVASFQHNKVPRTTGVATPITDYTTNLRVDTQRRRMPKT